jgi:hypothetical protein
MYEDEANYLRQIADALEKQKKTSIHELTDVVANTVTANNMTVVYNAENDTFIQQHINVDGGSFGNDRE